jgi:hypothetical protein
MRWRQWPLYELVQSSEGSLRLCCQLSVGTTITTTTITDTIIITITTITDTITR